METTPVTSRGQRASARSRVRLVATVFCSHFYCPVEVECTDVSPGGMFLAADLLLDPGERVTVSFTVPGTSHAITVDAIVVRATKRLPAGMGLRFDRLPSLDAGILAASLSKLTRAA